MDSVAAAAAQSTPIVPRGRPEHLFDIGPMRAEADQARASMPAGAWLRGPDGRPSAAGLGVLLDDVLGQAVLIRRLPGQWSVTTELNIDVAAPLPADGQALNASASPMLIDDGGGLAQGAVRDAGGRCLAVGTTWARFVVGIPDEIFDPPELPADVARGDCLSDLLGVRFTDAGLLDLPPRLDLSNPRGVIHGGVLFSLAVMSADQLLHDSQLEVASVRVVYLRPAVGELKFEPVIVHRGRSLGMVRVDVKNAAGTLCTSATVTVRSATGPRASTGPAI